MSQPTLQDIAGARNEAVKVDRFKSGVHTISQRQMLEEMTLFMAHTGIDYDQFDQTKVTCFMMKDGKVYHYDGKPIIEISNPTFETEYNDNSVKIIAKTKFKVLKDD